MNRTLTRFVTHGVVALLATASYVLPAAAAETAMSSSQSRMATCSKQNKGKKGDDFKTAQSDCLKGTATAAAEPTTPQQKMAMCSKQNKGKKGDDYRKSQSDCLRG